MADKHLNAEGVIKLLKGRKYKRAQVHHTYRPHHADFTGNNHQSLQDGMRNHHMNERGWQDIGQHLTLFPDGTFLTGRNFDIAPAGIVGYNTGSFMIEILGDFDVGNDKLEGKQLKAALTVYNYLITKCGAKIVFHREHADKTCPGTGIDKNKFVKAVKEQKTIDVSIKDKPKTKPAKTSKWVKKTGNWTGQTLKQGDSGTPVKQMQQMLADNHYYPEKGAKNNGVDGYYGSNTVDAVKRYQSMHGLTSDGIAGKKTYAKLKGKKASSKKTKTSLPSTVYKAVKPYPQGSGVRKVQKALASVYYYPNKGAKNNGVDGVYGPDTADAVKRYQSTHGLSTDGIYGPKTQKSLEKNMK